MFHLTTKTLYGLPAILDLVHQQGGGLVQARAIAERRNVPLKYLEQIFAALVKAGVVRSVRGLGGGYELARPASQTTAWEVIAALEGSRRELPKLAGRGVLRDLLWEADRQLARVFSITLADLAEREEVGDGAMYHI
ncbi:MAG: Rrf2 family transcriptional regulator [Proteobacteria bacterium]|nr:Rrf2 family transcriptional regulator [Pseudomonadota bacterium]